MVELILEKLVFNEEGFDSLVWKLEIIEGLEIYLDPSNCETRTYIKFSKEEFNAPAILRVEGFAAQISEAIKANKTLNKICLNGHEGVLRQNFTGNIGDSELRHLSLAFCVHENLTHIDLRRNLIGDEGAMSLAEGLRNNKTVETLLLSHNFVGIHGMISLAELLLKNDTLRTLEASHQLLRTPMAIIFQDDPTHKFLAGMIESSLVRRKELKTLPSFHSFLSREKAEQLVRSSTESPSSLLEGKYLFYLNESLPESIQLCFVAKQSSKSSPSASSGEKTRILHKSIYRSSYGFTFSRSEIPVASLTSYCCWKLFAGGVHVEKEWPAEMKQMMDKTKRLDSLWRLVEVPPFPIELSPPQKNAYPTLTNLVSKNSTYLKTPINRREDLRKAEFK